ncbi:MAG: tyrosine-type recombinase/integrase [Rhizobiaceae bacterium]|nr:tyrosine-type recombinase/integrase [Rhizobiaceae bacterium]
MSGKNAGNERTKRHYYHHLKHALGRSDQTIRQIARSLTRFETFTGRRDFKSFDQRQAVGFKESLTKAGLAPATVHSSLNDLKLFFGWLALQPGFKRAIKPSDIDYFNLSEKAVRAATAPAEKSFPTLQMIERVVAVMPSESAVEKRDRALIAFTAITGIRDGALVTLKLRHFDEARRLVLQDPKEVSTKFSKRIDTFLFPLNDVFEPIFLDWIAYLKSELLFGDHDPLFSKTALAQDDDRCFKADGLSREHWANAAPVRVIFKDAFRRAGLPEFTPHRFRDMIVSEMYRRGLSVSEFKAWSQNLGHEGAMTTLTSYGKLSLEEQGQLVRRPKSQDEEPLTLSALDEALRKRGL